MSLSLLTLGALVTDAAAMGLHGIYDQNQIARLPPKSPSSAIRRNINASGDTYGRAILVGSAMGALHGEDGETGIPARWVGYLTQI